MLLIQRNINLKVAGGFWAFPGGKVDKEDDESSNIKKYKRTKYLKAAVREVKEEIGLDIQKEKLIYFNRWITPKY